jgi:hypothetical protein
MRFQDTGRTVLAVLAISLLGMGAASAAACSKATLTGSYGVLSSGYAIPNSPTSGLYLIVADGNGHIEGGGVQSDNGDIEFKSVSGSYTVAKDCTGSMTLVDQTNIHADYVFVFDDKQSRFEFLRTDANFNESGEGRIQAGDTCGLRGKKTTVYADRLRGLGTPPVDIVGQITVAGTGKVTGEETVVSEGAAQSLKLTGNLALGAGCTGTLQLKSGGATFNFGANMMADGSLQLIETDTGSTVAGTATPQ